MDKITKAPRQNEIINSINDLIDNKQDTLIAGTNIKTVNNESLLGSGNIDTSVIPPIAYGTSTTAAATVQKEVSIPSITELKTGQVIVVQPTITSTVANSTIKLNDFDPYPMRYNNSAITTSSDSIVWSSNYVSQFVFDGTYWQFAGHGLDSNTTYTINYSIDAGAYKSGTGSYAISRYSLCMQKPDMTWEKVTATNANYSTGTSKNVNTNGFILGNIRYYGTTTNVANGANTASNTMYEKSASLDLRYSTNCGDAPSWTAGDYIYFVGTMGADGLFYLDTTTWWTNTLPSTNDGKLYVQLGKFLSEYKISLYENHPAYYYDGTKLCEYKIADNKQDTISDLSTIRSNAANGQSAYTTIGGYGDIVTHNTSEFATSAQGALANTALQPNDNISLLSNNAGYITSSALTGYATENFVTSQGYITSSALSPYVLASSLATVATSGSYNDLSNKPTIPTVGNGTITINQGGTQKGTFTVNQSGNTTINLDAGGGGTVDQTFDGTSTNAQSGVAIIGALTDGSISPTFGDSIDISSANLYYDSDVDVLYSNTKTSFPSIGIDNYDFMTETNAETGDNELLIYSNITSDSIRFSSEGGILIDTSLSGGQFTYNGNEIATLNDIPSLTNYVTTNTDQNITGVKTFVGQKRIGFKQSGTSDKLGFTLYNSSGTEKGYLEYNPSNTVDSAPLMTLGNYATSAASLTHVGFRKYSSISGASGAYNLLAPLISDAKTPFNLTTTYTNFYLPLGFTDGNTTVLTAKSGLVNISSLLPSLSGYATETWVGQQGYALASSLATVATSGSYADLSNKPTIPTDTADLINGAGFLTSSDLTDGSLDAAFYESLSIGGVSSFYDSEEDILSISGSPIKIGEAVTIRTETDPETGDNNLLINDDITADNIQFSSQGGISVDTSTSGGEFTYNGSEVATISDIPDTSNLANKDLSNLSATGEAHFQAPISDLATIRSGASAGATAVQPSDITDVVRQQTTDTINLYCWSSSSYDFYTTSETLTVSNVGDFVYNINYDVIGKITVVSSSTIDVMPYEGLYQNSCIRDSSKDTTFIRQTLTNNNSNALNITQTDGQWVISQSILVDTDIDLAVNTGRTFDLSSYLPSDNYNYEVLVAAVAQSTSTSGGTVNVSVYSDLITNTDDVKICVGRTRANSTIICGGNAIIPIGTGRTIGLHQANISGTASAHKATITNFRAIAYRRIGTNS